MEMPIDEMIDRYSIFLLKKEKIGGQEIINACGEYASALSKIKPEINPEWLLDLYNINAKIWSLEADLRACKITDLEEIGRRALKIREANKQRISIKNSIVEATGIGFKDVKVNHCSE